MEASQTQHVQYAQQHPGTAANVANPQPTTPGRPRAKSGFSLRSHDSNDTAPSQSSKSPKSKHERKESASDKRKTHYDPSTKANPNAAMNEAQPIAAALEKPTLQSLRSFQHTDANGQPIAEPDLSNPTRSRWERPLDTIRSFEAAIDGEYKRRTITVRGDQTDVGSTYGSRRSSYYGGNHEQQRYSQNSYYGHRQQRESYDNGYGMGGPVGGPPRARYGNRMQSDPGWNRQGNNVYGPPNGYHQSRDTVHTNGSGGSHSDGPSDNSSFERAVPVKSPYDGPDHGWQSHGDPARSGQGYFPPAQQMQQYPQQQQQAPPPPPHGAKPAPARTPIKLDDSVQAPPAGARPKVLSKNSSNGGGGDDKRKSWFKRRFSKD